MVPMLDSERADQVQKLDSTATAIENKMIQLKHSGKGQDPIRLPGMLMEKLSYLASTVAVADFKPADQYVEVYEKLHAEWEAAQQDWNQFINEDVAAFQSTMQSDVGGPLILGKEE